MRGECAGCVSASPGVGGKCTWGERIALRAANGSGFIACLLKVISLLRIGRGCVDIVTPQGLRKCFGKGYACGCSDRRGTTERQGLGRAICSQHVSEPDYFMRAREQETYGCVALLELGEGLLDLFEAAHRSGEGHVLSLHAPVTLCHR